MNLKSCFVSFQNKKTEKDAAAMYDMTYLDPVPDLSFLSEDSTEQIPEWEQLHRELSANERSVTKILSAVILYFSFILKRSRKKRLRFYELFQLTKMIWRKPPCAG